MGTTDVINYFRRSKIRRQRRKEIRVLAGTIKDMRYEIERLRNTLAEEKNWRTMYSQLVGRLSGVQKECALKDPTNRYGPYVLYRYMMYSQISGTKNGHIVPRHATNLYSATAIIKDYKIGDCIHFELRTREGILYYQYSKKGIAIQPIESILKVISELLANAWYKKIHGG